MPGAVLSHVSLELRCLLRLAWQASRMLHFVGRMPRVQSWISGYGE